MGYQTKKKSSSDIIIFVGITFLVMCLFLSSTLYAYLTVDYATIEVSDKERIVTGSGETLSSKFLIYADGEVLENSDSLWHWKWSSSDIQGDLKEGQTYKVKVYGWRVPFLSWYRNIIEIKEYN